MAGPLIFPCFFVTRITKLLFGYKSNIKIKFQISKKAKRPFVIGLDIIRRNCK